MAGDPDFVESRGFRKASPESAQRVFVGLAWLGAAGLAYVGFRTHEVLSSLADEAELIPFSTGLFYGLVCTIFVFLLVWQRAGALILGEQLPLESDEAFAKRPVPNRFHHFVWKHAVRITVMLLVGALVIGNVAPRLVDAKLEAAGYRACEDPGGGSAAGRGRLVYYQKQPCDQGPVGELRRELQRERDEYDAAVR